MHNEERVIGRVAGNGHATGNDAEDDIASDKAHGRESVVESSFDERVFGKGAEWLDGKPEVELSDNVAASNVAGRAKQFIPFAALRGFTEMVQEVSHSRDKIDEQQDDQEGYI